MMFWDLMYGLLLILSLCFAVGGSLWSALRILLHFQMSSIIDNIDKKFVQYEDRHFKKVDDIESSLLIIFPKLAQHDEELKQLNRKSELIKSDAEIREIIKDSI